MSRRLSWVLAAGAALLAAGAAHAGDIRQQCGSTTRADAIRASSVIVADALAPPEDRVIALRNRGFSYQQQGDLDSAIVDYDAAVKLAKTAGARPRSQEARMLAKVYVDRGVAWRLKGEPEKALADFDAALAVDPQLASAQENRDALFFRSR